MREVVVAQSVSPAWKEIVVTTGASASTLQDIKVPDSCGGYAYRDSGQPGSPVRNRFIYWRTCSDELELEESSLDLMLTGGHIRYRFQDTPIVGGVSVNENQGHVIILVATVACVHRLVFPHPTRRPHTEFSVSEHIATSIFYDASLASASDLKNMHMINPGGSIGGHLLSASSAVTADGQALFAVGTTAGSILTLKMPPLGISGVVIQHELSQSSVMHKLWTGLVPGVIRGHDQAWDSVICVDLHTLRAETYIFALCRDLRLRVWTMRTRECVLTVQLMDLLDDRPSSPPTSAGHMMKKVQSPNVESLVYCVYLSFPDRSQFLVLEPIIQDSRVRLELQASLTQPAEDLLDLCVTGEQLITLWTDSNGVTVARAALLSQGEPTGEWRELLLESHDVSEPVVPHDRDPREFFLDLIFRPNQFSQQHIVRALSVYRRSHDSSLSPEALLLSINLREEVVNAVSQEIRNSASDYEMSEEDFCQMQLDQWSRFYSCCCQYRQVGAKLQGVLADSVTGLVCLIRKASITYLRHCDLLERLYLCEHERLAPADLDKNDLAVDGLSPYAVCDDVHKLCGVLRLIQSQVTDDQAAQFVLDLQMLQCPKVLAHRLVDSTLFDDGTPSEAGSQIEIRLQAIQNLPACLDLMMQLLNVQEMQERQGLMDDSTVGSPLPLSYSQLFTSPEGTAVTARVFEQMCLTRLSMLRDLVMVQALSLRVGERLQNQRSHSLQTGPSIEQLLPHYSNLVRCYVILYWSSQVLTCNSSTSSLDSNMRRLSSLDLNDGGAFRATRQMATPTTVLESFIQGVGGTAARRQVALVTEDTQPLWSHNLIALIDSLAGLIWPMSEETLFPEFLAGSCQYMALQEYVRLFRSLSVCNDLPALFFLGLSYLHFDEPHKARHCFVNACEGVATETFLSQKLLQGAEGNHQELTILYYLKVIGQFEEHGMPDIVIELVNQAICLADPADPHLATLQSKVFKHHLELGHNHEAFTAMMANPQLSRRKDCLRQLVVVLSERGELQALVEFPYKDLEEEVVNVLECRARSVDLMSHNYYDLLYAFHMYRNNLRKAAGVMYEYGSRLGREMTGVRALQRQAQCYLVALNVLRLIHTQNAWIVRPTQRSLEVSQAFKSSPSKHTVDGLEKLTLKGRPKVEIVELKHLEKDYLLLDARLRLIRKNPDPALTSGPTPDAEEMVGVLVTNGLYDMAVIVCQGFGLQLHTVFSSLALRCVSLARCSLGDNNQMSEAWDWLRENDIRASSLSRDSSATDHAWKLLQRYLECFEEIDGRYHRCVCEKLLSQGFLLPAWLVNSYKAWSGPQLLRVYLDYDLLQPAAALLIEYLDAVMAVLQGIDAPVFSLKGVTSHSPMSVWVPYTCADQLLGALQRHQDDRAHVMLRAQLQDKITLYHNKLAELSAAA